MPAWPNTFFKFVFLVFFCTASLAAPDDARFNASKRFLYVQPGQTVSSIVKSLYPDQPDKWLNMGRQIVIANPHAFEKGNVSKLIVGARIEIPTPVVKPKVTPPPPVVVPPVTVGKVLEVRGKTFVIPKNKKRHDLIMGSTLYEGDRIYTGADGYLRMKMIDDAKIDLRCNSEMLIEDYKLLKDGNSSILHLIKGSLHKVTGKIGKQASDHYEMRTPMATIGVRGTEYALRVLQSHGCDGSIDVNNDGMFVKVSAGAVDIINTTGDALLKPGSLLLVANKKSKPETILDRPGIFDALPPAPVAAPAPVIEIAPPPPVVEPEQGTSWWWLVLGVLVLVAL